MVFLQNTTFSKIAMKDYQESQFQVLEYKIQDISANSESPNIIFAGLDYHRKDEVVIDNVAKNENKNINLISLN